MAKSLGTFIVELHIHKDGKKLKSGRRWQAKQLQPKDSSEIP